MKRGMTIGMLAAVVLLLGAQAFGGIKKLPICRDFAVQEYPKVSGNIVVWEDFRNGNWDIYGYDMSAKTEFPICTAAYEQSSPFVNGNIVVWTDERWANDDCTRQIIYGYDISSKTEFSVPWESGYKQENPVVGNNWIAYHDGDRISAYNLLTLDRVTIAENQIFPYFDIDNSRIVWSSYGAPDIMGYDLAKGQSFSVCLNTAEQASPVISGNFVAWMDYRNGNWDIFGKNLTNLAEFPICTEAHDQWSVDISGNTVVWQDSRTGDYEIYGFNLITGLETPYTNGIGPAVDGNLLVWRSGNDITGAYIPEPASLAILFAGAVLLIRKRRLERVC